ncbi:MAG: hypothetical protein MHM6MM_004719 [Cercozoa sp. M6MM]
MTSTLPSLSIPERLKRKLSPRSRPMVQTPPVPSQKMSLPARLKRTLSPRAFRRREKAPSSQLLHELPPEVLQHVCMFLSAGRVASLASSSKHIYEQTQSDRLWKRLLQRDFNQRKPELPEKYKRTMAFACAREYYAYLYGRKRYRRQVLRERRAIMKSLEDQDSDR